jgi:hypothetical protein
VRVQQATATIDLGDDAFDGTADILTTLDVTDAGRRTKTANSHFKLLYMHLQIIQQHYIH